MMRAEGDIRRKRGHGNPDFSKAKKGYKRVNLTSKKETE